MELRDLRSSVAAALLAAVLAPVPSGAQAPEGGPAPAPPLPDDLLPGQPEAPPMPSPDEGALADEGLESLGLPSEEAGREAQLDALFEQLARDDFEAWPVVQSQIWRIWRRSGSDSMDFLLQRALEATEAEELDAALVHLDDLIRLDPDFAEAWNQRATIHFLQGDYGRAMRDIEAVLALEPRHFGALSGLGIILDRTGNEAGALEVYRRALEIHPHLEGAQKGVDKLKTEVDGREL